MKEDGIRVMRCAMLRCVFVSNMLASTTVLQQSCHIHVKQHGTMGVRHQGDQGEGTRNVGLVGEGRQLPV